MAGGGIAQGGAEVGDGEGAALAADLAEADGGRVEVAEIDEDGPALVGRGLGRIGDDGDLRGDAGDGGAGGKDAAVTEDDEARGLAQVVEAEGLGHEFRADAGRIAHGEGDGGTSGRREGLIIGGKRPVSHADLLGLVEGS
jgi:hypothetical protein